MNASQRMVKENLSKINFTKFLEVFSPWKPEDFGRVDHMAEFYGLQSKPPEKPEIKRRKRR